MRDAKRDLLRLKSLKQSKSYACNVDFKWLVNTLRRYINRWVEDREIGMDLVEKLNRVEAREAELRDMLEQIVKILRDPDKSFLSMWEAVWKIIGPALSLSRPDFINDKEPVTQYCPECKEFADKLERMEQALRKIASKKPKEKPEWGDADDSGNYDDIGVNGWDICAWEVAEIAEQALEGSDPK